MKINVNGKTMHLDFFYYRTKSKTKTGFVSDTSSGHPIGVECRITLPGFKPYADGSAYCNPVDRFEKSIGRRLSLERALQTFSKSERRDIWAQYHARSQALEVA